MTIYNSHDRNASHQRFSTQNKKRVKYTRFPESDLEAIHDAKGYVHSEDLKKYIFFAKTAKNFYNMAKGYWRPTKKSKKNKIESSM